MQAFLKPPQSPVGGAVGGNALSRLMQGARAVKLQEKEKEREEEGDEMARNEAVAEREGEQEQEQEPEDGDEEGDTGTDNQPQPQPKARVQKRRTTNRKTKQKQRPQPETECDHHDPDEDSDVVVEAAQQQQENLPPAEESDKAGHSNTRRNRARSRGRSLNASTCSKQGSGKEKAPLALAEPDAGTVKAARAVIEVDSAEESNEEVKEEEEDDSDADAICEVANDPFAGLELSEMEKKLLTGPTFFLRPEQRQARTALEARIAAERQKQELRSKLLARSVHKNSHPDRAVNPFFGKRVGACAAAEAAAAAAANGSARTLDEVDPVWLDADGAIPPRAPLPRSRAGPGMPSIVNPPPAASPTQADVQLQLRPELLREEESKDNDADGGATATTTTAATAQQKLDQEQRLYYCMHTLGLRWNDVLADRRIASAGPHDKEDDHDQTERQATCENTWLTAPQWHANMVRHMQCGDWRLSFRPCKRQALLERQASTLLSDADFQILADLNGMAVEDVLRMRATCRKQRARATRTQQWQDCYAPQTVEDFCGNLAVAREFQDWLQEWVSGSLRDTADTMQALQLQRRHAPLWDTHSYGYDDFADDDYDYEGDDSDILTNCFCLYGPTGCGKSALVRTCAARSGFNVIEVNPGQARSAATIRHMFLEATQSHRMVGANNNNSNSNSRCSSRAGEDSGSVVDLACSDAEAADTVAAGSHTARRGRKRNTAGDESSAVVNGSGSKRRRRVLEDDDNDNEDVVDLQNGEDHEQEEEEDLELVQAKERESTADTADGTRNLILLEEVDIVFSDLDTGFASAVRHLAKLAKCPVVLTANHAIPGWFRVPHPEVRAMHKPPMARLLLTLACIAEAERVATSLDALWRLALVHDGDLRAAIMHLRLHGIDTRSVQALQTERWATSFDTVLPCLVQNTTPAPAPLQRPSVQQQSAMMGDAQPSPADRSRHVALAGRLEHLASAAETFSVADILGNCVADGNDGDAPVAVQSSRFPRESDMWLWNTTTQDLPGALASAAESVLVSEWSSYEHMAECEEGGNCEADHPQHQPVATRTPIALLQQRRAAEQRAALMGVLSDVCGMAGDEPIKARSLAGAVCTASDASLYELFLPYVGVMVQAEESRSVVERLSGRRRSSRSSSRRAYARDTYVTRALDCAELDEAAALRILTSLPGVSKIRDAPDDLWEAAPLADELREQNATGAANCAGAEEDRENGGDEDGEENEAELDFEP